MDTKLQKVGKNLIFAVIFELNIIDKETLKKDNAKIER